MKARLSVVVLALLLGCNTPAASIKISPKSINLVAGGKSVEFTATVTGFNAPSPNWSLESSAVDKGKLSVGSGVLVNYTPPVSVSGEVSVTITATIGVFKDSATITVQPASK
jgi:hypothetical protein